MVAGRCSSGGRRLMAQAVLVNMEAESDGGRRALALERSSVNVMA
jgi:hypothetical protein